MSSTYYAKQQEKKEREERAKYGVVERYSALTSDSQIEKTEIDHSYAFGERGGKAYRQVLKTQTVRTFLLGEQITDFKIMAEEFELKSDDMWEWATDALSAKIKEIIGGPKRGVTVNFGFDLKRIGGDGKDIPTRFIMIKADGSPTGYFINEWRMVKPAVTVALQVFRAMLNQYPRLKREPRQITFNATVRKMVMQEGISLLPFEINRAKLVLDAKKEKI